MDAGGTAADVGRQCGVSKHTIYAWKVKYGVLSYHESILAEGQASQTTSLLWEDHTYMTVDPSNDCTFWFAGNYLEAGATSSTTRIGAFTVPGRK